MVSSYGIAAGASAAVCCYYLVRELKKCQGFLEFDKDAKSGGELVAEVLQAHGIKHLFVLSGGHVAPVYCAAEALGIEVVDVRHEVTSVFAADAAWRLTGRPGVACVTAGPGVTNTVTAVQNAKMAESAVVVLGGATGTILKGRGSLQDIDHMSLMKSIVKWSTTCNCVADIVPAVRKALHVCQSGIPGPCAVARALVLCIAGSEVFVELPTDLLYPPSTVIQNVGKMMPRGRSLFTLLLHAFIHRHTNNLFVRASASPREAPLPVEQQPPSPHAVERTHALLAASLRPVLIIGSQSMQQQSSVGGLVAAVQALGVPVYTMGMARGLLGAPHADLPAPDGRQLLFRHKRADALKQADVVVLAGAVLDFRLQYGAAINPKAKLVVVNKSWANTVHPLLSHILFCCTLGEQVTGEELCGSADDEQAGDGVGGRGPGAAGDGLGGAEARRALAPAPPLAPPPPRRRRCPGTTHTRDGGGGGGGAAESVAGVPGGERSADGGLGAGARRRGLCGHRRLLPPPPQGAGVARPGGVRDAGGGGGVCARGPRRPPLRPHLDHVRRRRVRVLGGGAGHVCAAQGACHLRHRQRRRLDPDPPRAADPPRPPHSVRAGAHGLPPGGGGVRGEGVCDLSEGGGGAGGGGGQGPRPRRHPGRHQLPHRPE